MDPLDRNSLESLIEALSKAKKYGFESLSSPVEVLLEAEIDLLLLLSKFLKEGKESLHENPELRFSRDFVDSLGNPKQIRIHNVKPIWFDPETADFLKQLASFFVAIKSRLSFGEAVTASALKVVRPISAQKELKRPQRINKKALHRKNTNFQYYKRQEKKW